uniref:Protein-lysine N-methyltransferase n=1 Tax=Strongyloides stercoralis TaxID=6248 RepID=A0A0K0DX78_STRER
MNGDDDMPQLSAATLAALKEFLDEQKSIIPPETEPVPENWKLSQFWYSDETAKKLVNEAVEALGEEGGKIALVSSPTLMRFFRQTNSYREGKISVHLFEFDCRFGEQFPGEYSFYDYNDPLKIDIIHKANYDYIIADPPYLSDECLTAVSKSLKYLSKKDDCKILLCTGAIMEEVAERNLNVKRTNFYPKHLNNLSNDFCSFANYQTVLTLHQCNGKISILKHVGRVRLPINLLCGHITCKECINRALEEDGKICECFGNFKQHFDNVRKYPVNVALLKIIFDYVDDVKDPVLEDDVDKKEKKIVEKNFFEIVSFLRRVDCEKGGAIWSETLSTQVQKKIIQLISCQLMEKEGRSQIGKQIKSLVERIINEFSSKLQNPYSISTQLWCAVRQRGAQFLGPAMQEDILKLVCLTLEQGAEISRKNLVLYAVQMLTADYPQISKTSVGHVVQLLYRASCFTVIKREGKSSLMRLREEFRDYPSLRAEHDAQIVQIALEAGIRIPPEQWSSLLYGDQDHKCHMQSIIDRLLLPMSFESLVDDLMALISKSGDSFNLRRLKESFDIIIELDKIDKDQNDSLTWGQLAKYTSAATEIVHVYSDFKKVQKEKCLITRNADSSQRLPHPRSVYKTRMCREAKSGQGCRKGDKCTYAHSTLELRGNGTNIQKIQHNNLNGNNNNNNNNSLTNNIQQNINSNNEIRNQNRRQRFIQPPTPLVMSQPPPPPPPPQSISMFPFYPAPLHSIDNPPPRSPFALVPQSPNLMIGGHNSLPQPGYFLQSQPPTPQGISNHPSNGSAFFDGNSNHYSFVQGPVYPHYFAPPTPTFTRTFEKFLDSPTTKDEKPKPSPLNLHSRKEKNQKRNSQTLDLLKRMSIAEEDENQHVSRQVAESLFNDCIDNNQGAGTNYYEITPTTVPMNYPSLPGTPIQSPMPNGMSFTMPNVMSHDRYYYQPKGYSIPKTPTSKRIAYIWEMY